jgi:hypothetical protein
MPCVRLIASIQFLTHANFLLFHSQNRELSHTGFALDWDTHGYSIQYDEESKYGLMSLTAKF